jgi:hypothetical protein
MANGWGPPGKRWARCTYAGPGPKPPSFLAARVSRGKPILQPWHTNTAKPQRSPCSPTNWAGPCIPGFRGNTRLTSIVLSPRHPLRGEREPTVSLAHPGARRLPAPSLSTAPTVREQLDESPGAAPCAWTRSPAPLLGAPSPRVSWLPLPRVWNSRGVFSDTTRLH